MRGLLAVAWREISMKRLLFVAAAAAAVIPFLVPTLRGLHGLEASEARSATALAFSLFLLFGVSAFLGGTRLPGAIADRRIGFDFDRPLSSGAIWGGVLLGSLALAFGAAIVVAAPAALTGDTALWPNLLSLGDAPLPWPGLPWPVVIATGSFLAFVLFQVAGTALRARSSLLAVELLLIPAALFAAGHALIRLTLAGAPLESQQKAVAAFALLVLVGLAAAGYASVARGRIDARAAHRAQSAVFWTTLAAGIVGFHAYAGWLLSASPGELKQLSSVKPATQGPWVVLDGTARGAEASFLYDTSGGRFARVPWGTGEPVFSEDGLVAAWIERVGKTVRLRIVELNAPRPKPETRASLADDATGLVLDAHGSRAAVIGNDGVSIFNLRSGRLLLSTRIGEYTAFPRAFFLDPYRLRIYWFPKTGEKVRLDILELDVIARRVVRTGSITDLTGWPLLVTDSAGLRLACNEFEAKRLRLFDARNGGYLATLTEGASFAGPARFLADDRIVALAHRGGERLLEVFSPAGAPVGAIPLPGGASTEKQRSTALGGEMSPGALVLATGEPGNMPVYLVSVDTGSMRSLNLRGRPVSRWVAFFGRPNAVPAPGTPSTTLFEADSGALVRVDPASGAQRVILGKPVR